MKNHCKQNSIFKCRSDWLKAAGWGLFQHFLGKENETAEDYHCRVNAFDVEQLSEQLAALEVPYFFLSIGQNSGHYCSPNHVYEKLTGRGEMCSKRDLIADLSCSLSRRGIRLLVYLPSHAPARDEDAMIKLHGTPPWDFSKWSPRNPEVLRDFAESDERLKVFLRNWENVIAEWSRRWGKNVHGWWLDGGYYYSQLYDFADEPNIDSLAKAIRCGNPESIFALNTGVTSCPGVSSLEEDFTAGECENPENCLLSAHEHAVNHLLSYAGTSWNRSPLRFSAEELFACSCKIISDGGVITWDVPVEENGCYSPQNFAVLKEFSQRMKQIDYMPKLKLDIIEPPYGNDDGQLLHSGKGLLSICNSLAVKAAGLLTIDMLPRQKMSLEPGEIVNIPLELSFSGCAGTNKIRVGWNNQLRFLPFRRTRILGENAGKMLNLTVGGKLLGSFKLKKTPECIELEGEVLDPDFRPCKLFYLGSSVEFFVSDGQTIKQYFLMKETDFLGPGIFTLLDDVFRPAAKCRCEFVLSGTGYRFCATVPADGNLVELRCTVRHGDGWLGGYLFDSESASCDFSRYARFEKTGFSANY